MKRRRADAVGAFAAGAGAELYDMLRERGDDGQPFAVLLFRDPAGEWWWSASFGARTAPYRALVDAALVESPITDVRR